LLAIRHQQQSFGRVFKSQIVHEIESRSFSPTSCRTRGNYRGRLSLPGLNDQFTFWPTEYKIRELCSGQRNPEATPSLERFCSPAE